MRLNVYHAQMCLSAAFVCGFVTGKHENLPKCFQQNAEFLRSSQRKDWNKYLRMRRICKRKNASHELVWNVGQSISLSSTYNY